MKPILLLISKDETLSKQLSEWVSKEGYLISRADKLPDLSVEKVEKPSVLLIDLRKSEYFDVIQQVVFLEKFKGVPVICLLKDVNEKVKEELYRQGVYDVLFHPIVETEFLNKTTRCLAQSVQENDTFELIHCPDDIFRNLQETIAILDKECVVKYINHSVTGKPREEIIGKQLPTSGKYKEEIEELKLKIKKAISENETIISNRTSNVNGRLIDFEIKIVPYKYKDNRNHVLFVLSNKSKEQYLKNVISKRENALQYIIGNTSDYKGSDFFKQMILSLQKVTGASYAYLANNLDNTKVETIAVAHDGDLIEGFGYDLKDTPCENVVNQTTKIYESHIIEQFPKDDMLRDMDAEGYIGTPIFNREGECIAILVVVYKDTIKDPQYVKSIFELFAKNIANELVRLKLENELLVFKDVFDQSNNGISISDLEGNFTYVNKSFAEAHGYKPEEITGHNLRSLHSLKEGKRINDLIVKLHKDGFFKDVEVSHLHKNGTEFPMLMNAIVLRDTFGNAHLMAATSIDISLIKEQQKKLEESEKLYRLIFEQAAVGVARVDRNNHFIEVNSKFIDILGYSINDLKGVGYKDITHPDDLINDENMLEKVIDGSVDDFEMEKRYRHKSGRYIWVRLNVKIVRDKNGEFDYSISVITDIDRQKRLELELTTITNALDNSLNTFDIVDSEGKFIYVNKAYVNTWGYDSSEEIIGTSPNNHCAVPTVPNKIIEEVNVNGSCVIEFKAKRKDGSTFDVVKYVRKDYDFNGKVIYPGSALDISESKKNTEALKKSEERFNYAMQATNDGIFDWDLKTNEIYYSPGWKKMLGCDEHEIKNDFSEWERLTKKEDVDRSFKKLEDHLSGKSDRFHIEFQMKHKDGSWVDVLSRANAIKNANGEPVRMVGTHVNITQRKKTEKQLKLSENRFRSLAENVPGGIFMCLNDKNYTPVYLNDEVFQLTGVPTEKFLNGELQFNSIVHPKDLDFVLEHIAIMTSKKQPYNLVYRIKHADGFWRWIHEFGSGIYEKKSLKYFIGFFTDVTNQQVDKLIRESKLKLIDYSENNTINGFLQHLLDEIEFLTESNAGYYHFVNENKRELILQAVSANTQKEFLTLTEKHLTFKLSEAGVWGECFKKGKPVIHNSVDEINIITADDTNQVKMNRELAVPVIRDKKIVAILGVGNKPYDYNRHDVEIIQELADIAWEVVLRKQYEKALKDSQERLELLTEGAQLGMWDWNVQTGDVVFNERWAEMIGYSLSDLGTISIQTWMEYCHPEDLEQSSQLLEKHFKGELPYYECEVRMKHKKGHLVWVLDRGKVCEWTSDGKPLRMIGTHLDISQRKNAQKKIEESYTQYKTLADYTYEWEYWKGINNEFLYISPSCKRISGYEAEAFMNNPDLFLKIIHPDDKNSWIKHNSDEQGGETKFKSPLEFRIIHKNKNVVWINHVCQSVYNSEGQYMGNRGTNRDITSQKASEFALLESEQRFKNLSELTMEGIILHKEAMVIDMNSTCENLLGYKREELIGNNGMKLLIPEKYHEFMIAKMNSTATVKSELELIRKDGTVFPAEVVSRVISEPGNVKVIAIRDITEDKQIEQQLLNTIINTEEKERMRIAQDLHDGLGPQLSTIKLYIQTYLSSKNDELRSKLKKQMLNGIEDALKQVSVISNNLSPHVLNDFGLVVAIDKVIERYEQITKEKFSFDYYIQQALKIEIQITIYRIITELINNTVKHAKAKNIVIEILQVNDMIRMVYKDDGKGFNMGKMKGGKSGMGLFNIENRLKSFDGTIQFSSEVKKGVQYHIEIPDAFEK
jgi:PAS domain S-box-containing protein